MHVMIFIEIDISPRNGFTVNAVLFEFDLHFQGLTFETINILKTVKAGAQMRILTLIDVDICN